MYLIHSMLMRSVLTWVIYGFIPNSGGLVGRLSDYEDDAPAKSPFWTMVTAAAFVTWGTLLVYLSTLWRDKLDVLFVKCSQLVEELMLGKKSFTGVGLQGVFEGKGNKQAA
jgi:hypothetical protein